MRSRFPSSRALTAIVIVIVVLLVAVPACSRGGKSSGSVSVDASARSGSVVLRPGFVLSWKDGVFTAPGKVAGASVEAPAPPPDWFVPDGKPVDVTVDGPRTGLLDVTWRPPGAPPSPDVVPVVLRWNDPSRSWEPIAIGDVAGGATGSSGSFSPHWPGWASPKKLADAVSGAVRDLLGKRTDPPGCSGGPSWAELSPPGIDVVLTCLTTNRASDGTERAEVQLRNNRGYMLEVVVPAGVAYAFVDGQPELIRAAARAFTGRDSVLLSPGQLMTIGFTQPDIGAPVRIDAAPTVNALAAYVITKTVDETDGVLAVIKTLADCALGTSLPFDLTPSIDSVAGVVRAGIGCFTKLLSDPFKAEQVALAVVGAQAGVDATTAASDLSLATKAAGLASKIRLVAVAIKAIDVGADLIDLAADNYVNSTAGDYTGMSTQLSLHGKGPEPRLARVWGPNQTGYGEVRPTEVYNGGDPLGLIQDITWRSWGGSQAIGDGTGFYSEPGQDVAHSHKEPAVIVAFNLGTCDGQPAYKAVDWYFPGKGEQFDPGSGNICEDNTSATTPTAIVCPDISFTPQSEDGAFNIKASGVDCDAASDLIRQVRSEHNFYSGPRSFQSGEYACTVVTENTDIPVGHYTCSTSQATITWDKS